VQARSAPARTRDLAGMGAVVWPVLPGARRNRRGRIGLISSRAAGEGCRGQMAQPGLA